MEIEEFGLTHVCFRCCEKENIKNCAQNSISDPNPNPNSEPNPAHRNRTFIFVKIIGRPH